MFEAGLGFSSIIVLDRGQLIGAVDWFVVEDTIELEGEFERGDVDVEFSVDGVFTVEVELKGWIEYRKLFGEPYFEFGYTSSLGLVGIAVFGGA